GHMYQDIKESCEWKSVEKISKGWSSDEKYRIETKNDSTLLLRISNIANYIEKEKEFDIISKFSTCNTPMSMPISFGKCNDGRNICCCRGLKVKIWKKFYLRFQRNSNIY
ncbi:MAG: hypothetical protein RR446_11355, partial [Lachnospiraceae bacterium]